MRTLIAGGGTGGHITPAIALANELRTSDPGGEVLLVGRRGGMEEALVGEAGLPLTTIPVRGVDLSRPLMTARALSLLPVNVAQALAAIRRFRPDVVVGVGGYVCVPVVLAARALRLPVVLCEQNAYPGRAVRRLSRGAFAVAASFPNTAEHLPGVRVVHTGNPVRPQVLAALPAPLPAAPTRLLVTGGSQGARRINEALAGAVRDLLEDHPTLSIAHACGTRDADRALPVRAGLPEVLRDRYEVAPFFHDIAARIAAAHLVLMRAGGSSIAEVTTLGRPMLLVPYPHAGGHQRFNAEPMARAGAARIIADEELSSARLRADVGALLGDVDAWRRMAAASRAAGRPDAAERVAGLLREAAATRPRAA